MSSSYQLPLLDFQSLTCRDCKQVKPLYEFVRSRAELSGYFPLCRPCKRVRSRAYYHANREKMSQYNREYKAANPDRVKEATRSWRNANRERVREMEANRDRDKKRAKDRRYAERHRAVLNAKQLAYWRARYSEDPEFFAEQQGRRRARKLGAPVCDFMPKQWQLVKLLYGFRCAYCGCCPDRLHREHVVPLIKGGSHTLSNIVPACASCNARKARSVWIPVIRRPESWFSGTIERVLRGK